MVGSVILFFLFILVYILISDVITILFRLTGLTEEKARFQVVSLLTNSGFTTSESEVITNSKIRRKLAQATMLFGYAFSVTIVSTVVNIFLSLGASQIRHLLVVFPAMLGVVLAFAMLRHNHYLKSRFDRLIERLGNRLMFGKNTNPVVMLDDYGQMAVAQVFLNVIPDFLDGVALENSGLKEKHEILVMMLKSLDGAASPALGTTVLKEKDIIMVLGPKNTITSVFSKL